MIGAPAEILERSASSLADPAYLWYEDQTTVFRFENGRYRTVKTLPRVGGEHDGIDLYGNRKEPSAS